MLMSPLAAAFGASRMPTLGNGATLGNPQAAKSPTEQLAELLAQREASDQRLQVADDMSGAEYINNSGTLGVLSALANRYMGGRIRRKEGENAADLTKRILSAKSEADAAERMAEAQQKLQAESESRRRLLAQRQAEADQYGLQGDAARQYALTGDMPKDEAWSFAEMTDPSNPENVIPVFHSGRRVVSVDGTPLYGFEGQQAPQAAHAPTSGGGAGVLDQAFHDAQLNAESGGDPNAVSSKGARGLMQIMPATAADPGFGMEPLDLANATPEQNEQWGRRYMENVTAAVGGDPRLGLAAYNWGIGNVQKALQQPGATPESVLAQAPAETRAYVDRVMQRAGSGSAPRTQFVGSRPRNPAKPEKDAPSGYQWAADGSGLVPIPGGPADRKANPTPADQAKDERQMRQELTSQLKDQRTVVQAFQKVQAAAQNPNAMSDIALIYGYMKMLDPGSVVREGEFATAQNAAGVPDQVRNMLNRSLQGTRLNPQQRQQIVDEAKKVHDVAYEQIAQKEREYGELADQYGYDPVRATGSRMASPEARQRKVDAEQALQDARDAVRRGADPAKVRQRLQEMGFTNTAGRI